MENVENVENTNQENVENIRIEESSLTAPEDRDRVNRWKPNQANIVLSEEQVNEAMKELNNIAFVERFPRIDRTYADPPVNLQNYGLISFTPARGAKPNENGVYGFAKLRGNYATEMEANQRAEFLIRTVDSFHQIYHTFVGRPFPLTLDSKYSATVAEVDIRKEASQSISDSVKEKKEEEKRNVDDIHQREKNLLEEAKRDEVDPFENYITMRVKKAQLSWTFLEHITKMREIAGIIANVGNEINTMEATDATFKTRYFDKYVEARKASGINSSKEEMENNWMKFMVEDAVLPSVETLNQVFGKYVKK